MIGKKVKIISNSSGHAIPIGTEGIVERQQGNQLFLKGNGSWFYLTDVKILDTSKDDIAKNIDKLKSEIAIAENQLKFMDDNGLENYDEDQFKVYQTLTTLEDATLSKMDKAKMIADLISGGKK